jgi:aminoglycoside 2''-phosphotransferase
MKINPHHLERIRTYYPELSSSAVQVVAEGLVNDILIINNERVFRFPKAEWAREDQRREVKILNLVREYVDMPVPAFDRIEDDFVTYPLIPGESLLQDDILRLDRRDQDRLAEQLANFLRQLHGIPAAILEIQEIPQSVTVRQRQDWLKLYEDVQCTLFPLLMANARESVRRHFEPLLLDEAFMEYEPVLINGDLGPYHILYDRGREELNGIIDFGTAGFGDLACDVGCLINNYGETFVRRIARFYPAIVDVIERARFWAGTLELQWALGGVRMGDLSWLTVHIGRARDVMPVGSGWVLE